jgi:hypothetical protein
MLYKLGKSGKKFDSIDPQPFTGLPREKELEDLIAQNLWDVLFESSGLMPIFQERAWQPEADIYALNEEGDLVIFELKRDDVGSGAVHQALRYCEKGVRLSYSSLEGMFSTYRGGASVNLQEEHRVAFELEHPLEKAAFNKKQRLMIVGSAGDDELIRNVDYWKSKGLSLDFVPYRLYSINGEQYFEFFSLPHDQHSNPAHLKGVLFDTNRSYNEDSIWYMCENARVAAFGGVKGIIHSLRRRDIVFLYHKGHGIVAAGRVRSDTVREDASVDGLYHEIEWLTSIPKRGGVLKAMPAWEVKQVMNRNFWWAKTMKSPFLNSEDTAKLLDSLKARLA